MRRFLIATAALSLMGGAAFAQNTTTAGAPIADSAAPAGVTKGGAEAAGMPAANADGSPTMSQPAPDSSSNSMAPAAGSTGSASMGTGSSTTAMASDTPAGTPPAAYPVCTSKHEDRCVNRSQATRIARMHHKTTTTTTTTSETTPTGL